MGFGISIISQHVSAKVGKASSNVGKSFAAVGLTFGFCDLLLSLPGHTLIPVSFRPPSNNPQRSGRVQFVCSIVNPSCGNCSFNWQPLMVFLNRISWWQVGGLIIQEKCPVEPGRDVLLMKSHRFSNLFDRSSRISAYAPSRLNGTIFLTQLDPKIELIWYWALDNVKCLLKLFNHGSKFCNDI